jgi:hypothetical protein
MELGLPRWVGGFALLHCGLPGEQTGLVVEAYWWAAGQPNSFLIIFDRLECRNRRYIGARKDGGSERGGTSR